MSTFSELADSQPRIGRDVLFTETPQGVVFHNAKGGFHLNAASGYRLASIVVPHLDGTATLRQLAGEAGEQQQKMLALLVSTLFERGFARDARGDRRPQDVGLKPTEADAFGAQIDYVSHYVADGAARFVDFRQTRIAVVGVDDVARWVVTGLVRNGAGRLAADPEVWRGDQVQEALAGLDSAQVDIERTQLAPGPVDWNELSDVDIVCVTGPTAAAQTHSLLAAGVPDGKKVLPVWTIGRRLVMGPLATGTDGEWSSVVRSIGREFPASEATLWHQVAHGAAAGSVPAGPISAMVGNHLAYEVFRLVTECLPSETRGGVIIQDVDSLDVRAERVLPDPAERGVAALPVIGLADVVPHEEPYDASAHEGAAEDDPVAKELNARSALVQRHCGLIREFTDDEWTQVPLKVSSATYSAIGGTDIGLATASLDHVADARLRLLDRIAVHHAATAVSLPGTTQEQADVAAGRFLHAAHPGVRASQWSVPATDLITGEVRRVPVDAVSPAHPDSVGGFGRVPIGWAAGPNLSTATARALRESLVHAALDGMRRGSTAAAVDLQRVEEQASGRVQAGLHFLRESAQLLGTRLETLQLPAPGQACSVVLARDAATGLWSVAGGLDLSAAMCDAVRDLLGSVQLHQAGWTGESITPTYIEEFDAWTVAGGEQFVEAPPEDWAEAGRRAQIANATPVLVRTTTAALHAAVVETAAVILHRDRS